MRQDKSIRGFSLTEFAIVLGVMGAIFGAVFSVSASIQSNAKQAKFSQQLVQISGNIRGYYAGKAYFDSTLIQTMMPILYNENVFPQDSVHMTTYAGNPYPIIDTPFGEFTNPNLGDLAVKAVSTSLFVCGWLADPTVGGTQPAGCHSSLTYLNVPLFAIETLLPAGPVCTAAALRNSNPSVLPGLVAVYIDGNKMPSPLTLSALPASCKDATTQTINYVDFVFRLTPQS